MTPIAGALAVTEKAFSRQVTDYAHMVGWEVHHHWLSVRSQPGWPDLALVRPPRLILAELKTERGKTTPHQDHWLEMLEACATPSWYPHADCPTAGLEVYLWRPSDWDEIVRTLR